MVKEVVANPGDRAKGRGTFIVLEGPDGGGKTTQMARLADWLRGQPIEVLTCRDPGGTRLGEQIRGMVKDQSSTLIGLRAEMLLFMASRAQMVEEVILPGLSAGQIVLCDRFLLSNLVYQGFAGGLPIDEIRRVGEVATGGLWPDLTIVLDIDPEKARERTGPARDRIEERPESYRRDVRGGYRELATTLPNSTVVLDGGADLETLSTLIRNEVARALGIGSRS